MRVDCLPLIFITAVSLGWLRHVWSALGVSSALRADELSGEAHLDDQYRVAVCGRQVRLSKHD